jgi:hypothetical protein
VGALDEPLLLFMSTIYHCTSANSLSQMEQRPVIDATAHTLRTCSWNAKAGYIKRRQERIQTLSHGELSRESDYLGTLPSYPLPHTKSSPVPFITLANSHSIRSTELLVVSIESPSITFSVGPSVLAAGRYHDRGRATQTSNRGF